jgi:hypothetical protein
MRPNRACGRSRDLPVPAQGASIYARVLDHAGSGGRSRWRTRQYCLPMSKRRRHPGSQRFSRLDGWPICSPADASPTSSRSPAHGSGPMWVATPSSQWTFTTYSLPVSRRTYSRFVPLDRSTAQGGLCHEASAQPVAQPDRSSATRINRQLSGWNLPPLVKRAFGAHRTALKPRPALAGGRYFDVILSVYRIHRAAGGAS